MGAVSSPREKKLGQNDLINTAGAPPSPPSSNNNNNTCNKSTWLTFVWVAAVVIPWTLLLAPNTITSQWEESIPVAVMWRFWTVNSSTTNGSAEEDPTTTLSVKIPQQQDDLQNCIFGDFQMGSLAEVVCGDETDSPNKIYWCKATVVGIPDDKDDGSTYTVSSAIDQTRESVHAGSIRPYKPPEEHELLQYFEDGLFYSSRIDRVHKDGTVNIYVAYYDDILKDVLPDLLRRDESRHKPPPFKLEPGVGFQKYLNPRIFEDPQTLEEIAESLQDDKVVVILDAFLPEFAEAMWYDLDQVKNWELNQDYDDDGFHYSHHNIYDDEGFTAMMNDAYDMFESEDSIEFIANLTKRDVSGEMVGSPSYYMPGDYSMPHADFAAERTVAFVWHLSKNWQPEWGGALFWSAESSFHHAFQHASYNTLSLFNVRHDSVHFVTKVAPQAMEKRFAFNGWWSSEFEYDIENVPYEELYASPEQMKDLSKNPTEWLMELELEEVPIERREKFEEFQYDLENFLYPEPKEVHGVFPEE